MSQIENVRQSVTGQYTFEIEPESTARAMASAAENSPDHYLAGIGYPANIFVLEPPARQTRIYLEYLAQTQGKSVRALQMELGGYKPTAGLERTRRILAKDLELSLGIQADYKRTLLAHGNTQVMRALAVVMSRVLEKPVIIVDDRTYTGALSAFADLAEIISVPFNNDGPDPQAFRETVKNIRDSGKQVAFYYAMPDYHNPTSVAWSMDCRKAILQALNELDVICLEDSAYSLLTFPGNDYPIPLAALDTNGKVIFAQTYSKYYVPTRRKSIVHIPMDLVSLDGKRLDLHDVVKTEMGRQTLFSDNLSWLSLEAQLHDANMVQIPLREVVRPRAQFYGELFSIFDETLEHYLGDTGLLERRRDIKGGFFNEAVWNSRFTSAEISAHLFHEHQVITTVERGFIPKDAQARNPHFAAQSMRFAFSAARYKATTAAAIRRDVRQAAGQVGIGARAIHGLPKRS